MGDVQREMNLEEWCGKLPHFHFVNKQLKKLQEQVAGLQSNEGLPVDSSDLLSVKRR